MSFSRQRLYDWLDAAGLDFRASLGALIDLHGLRQSEWSAGLSNCDIPVSGPFLTGLAHPPRVTVHQYVKPADYIPNFSCAIRQSDQASRNLDIAAAQLEQVFGPGTVHDTSNTRGFRWADGFACVSATIFPPDLQGVLGAPNPRHAKVPGSATECYIHICPDYAPPLTNAEHRALEVAKPVSDLIPRGPVTFPLSGSFHYPDPALTAGLYIGADHFIIRAAPDRLRIVPLPMLETLELSLLTPAKGSGHVDLTIRLTSGETLDLIAADYPEHSLITAGAEALSSRLNIPLTTDETPDI